MTSINLNAENLLLHFSYIINYSKALYDIFTIANYFYFIRKITECKIKIKILIALCCSTDVIEATSRLFDRLCTNG